MFSTRKPIEVTILTNALLCFIFQISYFFADYFLGIWREGTNKQCVKMVDNLEDWKVVNDMQELEGFNLIDFELDNILHKIIVYY